MKHRFSSIIGMLSRIVCLWAILLLVNVPAQQPKKGMAAPEPQAATPKVSSGNSAQNIPVEIDNNLILMKVSVNGSRPLKFIFDTGASYSAIDSNRVAELGLKTEGGATVSATGGAVQGSFIKGVSLSVPGALVTNQVIVSMPFPAVPGFEFDGVIGYDFINEFVVELNYLNKTMTLRDPQTFAYKGKGAIIPVSLASRTPLVHTQITMAGRSPFEAQLQVDTGGDGTFIINERLVKKHDLVSAVPKATQDRGRGLGGEQSRLLVQVIAARLGRFVFKNPPVALVVKNAEGSASDEYDGIIGGEIFRRFTVILDYSRKRMILEPNESFNDPYDIDDSD